VGTQGILRTVQEKLKKGRKSILSRIPADDMTPKDICDAAERGDSVGIDTLRDVGTALGVGLGSVANLLNLQRIVAGGGVANAGDYILEPARKSLAKTALTISAEVIDLVPAKLGEAAGIIGAARLAMLVARKK